MLWHRKGTSRRGNKLREGVGDKKRGTTQPGCLREQQIKNERNVFRLRLYGSSSTRSKKASSSPPSSSRIIPFC